MKNKFLCCAIVFIASACNNQEKRLDTDTIDVNKNVSMSKTYDSILTPMILILNTDSAEKANFSYSLFNADKAFFTEIKSEGEEPVSDKLKGEILAYYPEYYLVHFEVLKLTDSFYTVKVGAEEKLIKFGRFMKLTNWNDYLSSCYFRINEKAPLRKEPFDSAPALLINDYAEWSFKAIDISGDWIKVVCNDTCEGCPEGATKLSGWIRWRKDNKLIVKLYYTC